MWPVQENWLYEWIDRNTNLSSDSPSDTMGPIMCQRNCHMAPKPHLGSSHGWLGTASHLCHLTKASQELPELYHTTRAILSVSGWCTSELQTKKGFQFLHLHDQFSQIQLQIWCTFWKAMLIIYINNNSNFYTQHNWHKHSQNIKLQNI